MRRRKRARSTLRKSALIGVAAIMAAACTRGAGAGDKAGGRGEPVVLRVAEGAADSSTNLAVAEFVRRVGELSDGDMRIQLLPDWGGTEPMVEQNIVRGVAEGKVDLGLVGTRVFDTLGVRSFQALTAPMLIDSYSLEQAVIGSDIPARMLGGLGTLKVTGLAVLGDGLRKPIAVEGPLLGPADWQGVTFAAFRSQGQAEAVQALGARATDLWNIGLTSALASGEVQGFENNLFVYRAAGRQGNAPYVTANVNLWPRTVAVVANPDRLSRLTAVQEGWLRQAAKEAAAHSTSLVEHEDQIVTDLCQAGARFANASEADLAKLRAAFAPVYSSLERDPQTKSFITRIEVLKRSTPAGAALAIPPGCTGPAPDSARGGVTSEDSIAGTWTTGKITENEWVRAFIAAGGTEKEAHSSFGATGTTHWSLRFDSGSFMLIQQDGSIGYNTLYRVNGDGTLTLWSGDCTHPAMYRYDLTSKTLRLHTLTQCSSHDAPYNTALFASFPFTRSG